MTEIILTIRMTKTTTIKSRKFDATFMCEICIKRNY